MSQDTTPAVHLCVTAPAGAWAGLHDLELALALRDDLRALGLAPTLARRRLQPGAINYVIGVEHGFDAAAAQGHACVLVRGTGEASALSTQARRLLKRWPVLDADPAAVAAYRADAPEAPPYALWQPAPDPATPWQPTRQRPLGLVVEGPLNDRQHAVLAGLQRLGLPVHRIDVPLAGPERRALLSQAQAWLALLQRDDAAPDLMALRLAQRHGVPVLAEVGNRTALPSDAEHAHIRWFEARADDLLRALADGLGGPEFAGIAERDWRSRLSDDRLDGARAAYQLGQQVWAASQQPGSALPVPDRLHLDDGRSGYRPGWFNVGEGGDAVGPLDAAALPRGEGQWTLIDVGERRLDDPATAPLLDTALRLLAPEGRLVLQLGAGDAHDWSERLAPWLDRFWERGVLQQRLSLAHAAVLGDGGMPVAAAGSSCVRLVLARADTSLAERSRARVMRHNLSVGA